MENLLLFIDDDLRETGLAMTRIEGYLARTLTLIEHQRVARGELLELAHDTSVLEQVDHLTETLENLRRRLAKLAAHLRP